MKVHAQCQILINADESRGSDNYEVDKIDRKMCELRRSVMSWFRKASTILRKSDKTFSEKAESYSHRSQKKSMASSRSSKSIQLKVKEERARIAELEIEASFLRQQENSC